MFGNYNTITSWHHLRNATPPVSLPWLPLTRYGLRRLAITRHTLHAVRSAGQLLLQPIFATVAALAAEQQSVRRVPA